MPPLSFQQHYPSGNTQGRNAATPQQLISSDGIISGSSPFNANGLFKIIPIPNDDPSSPTLYQIVPSSYSPGDELLASGSVASSAYATTDGVSVTSPEQTKTSKGLLDKVMQDMSKVTHWLMGSMGLSRAEEEIAQTEFQFHHDPYQTNFPDDYYLNEVYDPENSEVTYYSQPPAETTRNYYQGTDANGHIYYYPEEVRSQSDSYYANQDHHHQQQQQPQITNAYSQSTTTYNGQQTQQTTQIQQQQQQQQQQQKTYFDPEYSSSTYVTHKPSTHSTLSVNSGDVVATVNDDGEKSYEGKSLVTLISAPKSLVTTASPEKAAAVGKVTVVKSPSKVTTNGGESAAAVDKLVNSYDDTFSLENPEVSAGENLPKTICRAQSGQNG